MASAEEHKFLDYVGDFMAGCIIVAIYNKYNLHE